MTDDTQKPMKRLFLLRHAMALSDTAVDKNRTLAPKGKEDAQALGALMKRKSYTPDYVVCSDATRTRQTLEGLKQSLGEIKTQYTERLYHGSVGDYLSEIQNVSDDVQNLMILAHNPSIYGLVRLLAKEGEYAQRLCEGYQPATLSVFDLTLESWKDIQPAENELSLLTDPMDYNAPARPTRWM